MNSKRYSDQKHYTFAMVEFIFKLSADPEFKVIPRTPTEWDETNLMFPIDEDDEAGVLGLCQKIIKHRDLTKLKYTEQIWT